MDEKLIANPSIVLREEFDDWALLFDPNSGEAYGLNPVSAFVWKRLDGKHTLGDILEELKKNCEDVPEKASEEISMFVQDLKRRGFAGSEI